MGAIFASSTTSINETERCLRSKTHGRADWRSTLRYTRGTQCTPNCDINRLRTPQNWIGTAFATGRPIKVRSKVTLRFAGAQARNTSIVVSVVTSFEKLRAAGLAIVRTKTS